MIFIDGLHEANQVYRDLCGAILRLSRGGFIVLDDILPKNRESSLSDESSSISERVAKGMSDRAWFGDTFKVVALLDKFHPEINIEILGNSPVEHGQAILTFWEPDDRLSFVPFPGSEEFFASISYADVFGDASGPTWRLRRMA